jgi:hypothetical protein
LALITICTFPVGAFVGGKGSGVFFVEGASFGLDAVVVDGFAVVLVAGFAGSLVTFFSVVFAAVVDTVVGFGFTGAVVVVVEVDAGFGLTGALSKMCL